MKKILLFFLMLLLPCFALAEVRKATLINVVTGEKRVVVVGVDKFQKDEVLMGKELGGRTMSPIWNITDLDVEIVRGNFADATTTVIALANPFNATSTLDLFFYNQTGAATTTYSLQCGTSTNAFNTPTARVVNTGNIATGTLANIASDVTLGSGFTSVGASMYSTIGLSPSEYFVCKVTTSYPAGFTNAANTYAGSYKLRFYKFN